MDEVMTPREAAWKIEWEGGVVGALEWGLKPEHIAPSKLHDLWEEMYVEWAKFEKAQGPVAYELDEILGSLDEEDEE